MLRSLHTAALDAAGNGAISLDAARSSDRTTQRTDTYRREKQQAEVLSAETASPLYTRALLQKNALACYSMHYLLLVIAEQPERDALEVASTVSLLRSLADSAIPAEHCLATADFFQNWCQMRYESD